MLFCMIYAPAIFMTRAVGQAAGPWKRPLSHGKMRIRIKTNQISQSDPGGPDLKGIVNLS